MIAEHLNSIFCSVGKRVQEQINSDATLDDFTYPQHPPVFEFHQITESDVAEAINRLSSSPSCSLDQITALMLKEAKTELLPILSHLFNLSISKRTFPEAWKISKVTPLFKAGRMDSSENYRPISIIATIGKVLERLVHSQCTAYLKQYDLLNENQFGFREKHSTGTCLVDFLHSIYEEVDKGGSVGTIYLDLSKAFDSVDHQILSLKLRSLGFRLSSICWFESYLNNHTQCTKVNDTLSKPMINECGVPQGSILGPLLFICYVNDMPYHLTHSRAFLYADDAAIIVKNPSVDLITERLQCDLNKLKRWFDANKLCLNIKKTKSMLLSSNRSAKRDRECELKIDNANIESVNSFKYLGVHID